MATHIHYVKAEAYKHAKELRKKGLNAYVYAGTQKTSGKIAWAVYSYKR